MTTPDLTLTPKDAHVSRYGDLLYMSQGTLSKNRGIDIEVMKLARKSHAPGFYKNKSQVNWSKLQPWLIENYSTLETEVIAQQETDDNTTGNEREVLELQKLKEQVTELRNNNNQRNKNFISRKVVNATLFKLFNELCSQGTRVWVHEHPVRCGGFGTPELAIYNAEAWQKLLQGFRHTIQQWQECGDMEQVSQ